MAQFYVKSDEAMTSSGVTGFTSVIFKICNAINVRSGFYLLFSVDSIRFVNSFILFSLYCDCTGVGVSKNWFLS